MDDILTLLRDFETKFEYLFNGIPKWQLILSTITLTSGGLWFLDIVKEGRDVFPALWDRLFGLLTKVPMVRSKIDQELLTVQEDIKKSFYEQAEKEMQQFGELPRQGKTEEEIKHIAKTVFKLGRFDWKQGKISGGVMAGSNDDYTEMLVSIYHQYSWSNPLHADVFPGVRKMEAEIVRMTAAIFHGDPDVAGCVTSGGTESIVMAMKAFRDWGREVRGVYKPEIVASETAHPAVDKGADMLGFKFRKIAVDPKTWKVKAAAIERAINKNTVMIFASAPEYAHGIIDDIEELSKMAEKHGIPLHVDCCLGGFILPFMDSAGYPLPPFDFRLPGVTSISADTHKYGNSPKGTSVVLYRHKEYRRFQYFTVSDWPGGIYASPAIAGSRAGAHIAMCWAGLLYFGYDGFAKVTNDIISVARKLKKEIPTIDGLYIIGDPLGPVVSFGSNDFNILQITDAMVELGWHLQPLQNPPSMHIFLTSLHTADGIAESIIRDLKVAVAKVKSSSGEAKEGWARIYATVSEVPHKSIVKDASKFYLDAYYSFPEKSHGRNN